MSNSGQFKKGNPGRKPGSKNKVNTSLRKIVSKFLLEEWKTIKSDWNELSPKQRVIMFEKLLNYTVPKYSSVSLNLDSMSEEELETIARFIREKEE